MAQTTVSLPDSSAHFRRLETQFIHGINRYNWQAQLDYGFSFHIKKGEKGTFWIKDRFASEALFLGSVLTVRDENEVLWALNQAISPKITALTKGKLQQFSQDRALSQHILGGVRLHPKANVQIEPLIGFALDRRKNEQVVSSILHIDSGLATALGVKYAPNLPEGMQASLESRNEVQFISPRQNHLFQVRSAFQRQQEKAQWQIEMRYGNLRRDSYQSAVFLSPVSLPSETIEAITGDTLQTMVQALFPIGKKWKLSSNGDFSLNNRAVRTLQAPTDALYFDTDLNRRKLNGEIGLEYQYKQATAKISSRFGAETEARRLVNAERLPPAQAAQKSDLLRRTEFDRGFFSLNGSFQTPLSFLNESWQMAGNFASNILRHDTPDTNPDDRDEVFHNGEWRLIVPFDAALALNLQVLGTFYHTVYLKAERSAENNIQRSLRFRPAVRWKPNESLSFIFTPEVRATYTTDDFELAGRLKNDQSARELSYDLQIENRWQSSWEAKFEASYSDLRLGRLLWKNFAEIPFDTVQTIQLWARVKTGNTWTAELGWRFYQRSDFDRATNLRYNRLDTSGNVILDANGKPRQDVLTRYGREIVSQFGPTTAFTLPLYRQSMIRADGWLQFQRIRQRLYGALPDSPSIREALRGSLRLIPNVSLGVVWRI